VDCIAFSAAGSGQFWDGWGGLGFCFFLPLSGEAAEAGGGKKWSANSEKVNAAQGHQTFLGCSH